MNESTHHDGPSSWPSTEVYNLEKSQFLQLCVPTLEQIVKPTLLFSDLNTQYEQELAVLTLSRFMFGASMVDKRMGFSPFAGLKKTDNEIVCPTFAYNINGDYFFNRTWLINVIKEPHLADASSIVKHLGLDMDLGDYSEIKGIEEGAHKIFFTMRPRYYEFHAYKTLSEFKNIVEYDAQDHEAHALLWQLQYVRRYFFQYYPTFKAHYDRVIQFRRERKVSEEI